MPLLACVDRARLRSSGRRDTRRWRRSLVCSLGRGSTTGGDFDALVGARRVGPDVFLGVEDAFAVVDDDAGSRHGLENTLHPALHDVLLGHHVGGVMLSRTFENGAFLTVMSPRFREEL